MRLHGQGCPQPGGDVDGIVGELGVQDHVSPERCGSRIPCDHDVQLLHAGGQVGVAALHGH